MSKRFGRNQKRKLVADLATMQKHRDNYAECLTMEQGLVREQRRTIDGLNHSLRIVADCLGEHFYGLPPVQRKVSQMYPGQQYRMPKPISRDQLGFLGGQELSSLVEHSVYSLQSISGDVMRDKYTGSVHIMLQTPDGRVQYAISAKAWEELKHDQRLLAQRLGPMISDEMAHFIARGEK